MLSNKQQRGAFGQGRMEVIVQDGLPKGCYEFQFTLPTATGRTAPFSCRTAAAGDRRQIPARSGDRLPRRQERRRAQAARRRGCARTSRRHVGDIAEKYLIPGETQDLALMFVPSESVYAELHEGFDDIVQKAFRAQVVIVSPSLLMLAIQVIQQIQKDARMREAADQIHAEVGHLMDDLKRLHERVVRLQQHFGQANEDVRQILISAEKIERRGTRIQEVEFEGEERPATEAVVIPAPLPRRLHAGE